MLWLIWVGLMLAVPLLAGIQVWFEVRRTAADATATVAISAENAPAD